VFLTKVGRVDEEGGVGFWLVLDWVGDPLDFAFVLFEGDVSSATTCVSVFSSPLTVLLGLGCGLKATIGSIT